jgi:hypothetical protein
MHFFGKIGNVPFSPGVKPGVRVLKNTIFKWAIRNLRLKESYI